ncbi:MAG TPA: hypothetical protein VKB75_12770, partial [Jatrophihabitans sp.]|nr:hypothetical protein [Jatrophihabitans sp.]
MLRVRTALTAAALGLAALIAIPAGQAGSATSCVAWASMPAHVSLGPNEVKVHVTLTGTAACRGVTADSGGSGTLNGPGPSTSDFPLMWDHLGASDTADFYASLNTLGTYRVAGGSLQTYDAQYNHIPYTWRTTAMVVKYAGRFARVTHQNGRLTASLRYYARDNWRAESGVAVHLQRYSSGAWRTVATHRTAGSGWVSFRAGRGNYRLVSDSTNSIWSATG